MIVRRKTRVNLTESAIEGGGIKQWKSIKHTEIAYAFFDNY